LDEPTEVFKLYNITWACVSCRNHGRRHWEGGASPGFLYMVQI